MDLDKRQSLYDLTENVGYPRLIEFMEELTRAQENEVLRYNLQTGGTEGLILLKAEAQGARKLRYAIETQLKKIRVAASEAKGK